MLVRAITAAANSSTTPNTLNSLVFIRGRLLYLIHVETFNCSNCAQGEARRSRWGDFRRKLAQALTIIDIDSILICNDSNKEKSMVNTNLIPAYADGYEIRYDRPSDTFRCFQTDPRLKNNGKAFAPKSLARATQFMTELGPNEITKNVRFWMPRPPPKISPLVHPLPA